MRGISYKEEERLLLLSMASLIAHAVTEFMVGRSTVVISEIVGNIHDNPELMKGEHDPRNCEYFIPDKFGGWGGCIGTKEIDPCEGAKCKRWKQKER